MKNFENKSQNQLIRKRLASGKSITQVDASRDFKCSRLASRIYDLKREGVKIDKTTIQLPTGKHVASYREAR